MRIFQLLAVAVLVIGCATSAIQPMSKDTFKVATNAESACGPNGARNVAFKTAAVEVLRRGGDKFIIVGDQSDSEFWTGSYKQDMVIKMIADGAPDASNALSAKEQLGPGWQEIMAKGAPVTCG